MLDKKTRRMRIRIFLIGCVALLSGVLIGQHVTLKKKVDMSQFTGTLLEEPRKIQSFALTGTDGAPFSQVSLQGQWTMMFFGFTHCGYLCPTVMTELGKMMHLLENQAVKPLPKVVMVTLDPERDDVKQLRHFVKAFDKDFYGARGDKTTIKAMTHALGIAYAHVSSTTMDNIEHTGTIILFNPAGKLAAFFTVPHKAEALAHDYSLLISARIA